MIVVLAVLLLGFGVVRGGFWDFGVVCFVWVFCVVLDVGLTWVVCVYNFVLLFIVLFLLYVCVGGLVWLGVVGLPFCGLGL